MKVCTSHKHIPQSPPHNPLPTPNFPITYPLSSLTNRQKKQFLDNYLGFLAEQTSFRVEFLVNLSKLILLYIQYSRRFKYLTD